VQVSTKKTTKERRIEELTNKLNKGDSLIATELSRIGRSTAEVITLINQLVQKGINVIIVKQGFKINSSYS
jgi:putative DNA-invertase from lambdoid prophage Rac